MLKQIYKLLCLFDDTRDRNLREKIKIKLSDIVYQMIDIKLSNISDIHIYRTDDFGFKANYDENKFIQVKFYAAVKEISIDINRTTICLKEDVWS